MQTVRERTTLSNLGRKKKKEQRSSSASQRLFGSAVLYAKTMMLPCVQAERKEKKKKGERE